MAIQSSSNASTSSHRQYMSLIVVLYMVTFTLMNLKESSHVGEIRSLFALPADADAPALRKQNKRLLAKKSSKFPPISCHDVFAFNRNLRQNVSDPNQGRLNGRYTNTEPPFWISLHNKEFDGTRWDVMEVGVYYERLQSEAFVKTLTASKSEQVHVVDVGGNIGWYSLMSVAAALAADKSIVVDVFEPNPRNRLRLCESLHLNKWIEHEKVAVNIYPVGVSAKTGGSIKMGISGSGTGRLGVYDEANQTETVVFPLVSLDDLADELNWDGAHILKVDVEGLEMEVFQGAARFLKSGRVENIFFEGNTRDVDEVLKFRKIVRLLIESGSYAYMFGTWMGPSTPVASSATELLVTNKISDKVIDQYTESLMKQCQGDKQDIDQCNLWWRRRSQNVSHWGHSIIHV